jgi:hypothetical protein
MAPMVHFEREKLASTIITELARNQSIRPLYSSYVLVLSITTSQTGVINPLVIDEPSLRHIVASEVALKPTIDISLITLLS